MYLETLSAIRDHGLPTHCSEWQLWPRDRTAKLRELCRDKSLSAAKIARALGLSRGAVVGKCYREGIALPGRKHGTLDLTAEEKRARSNRLRREHRARRSPAGRPTRIKRLLASLESLSAIDPGQLKRIGLMELSSQTCRWPYGEAPEVLYCGAWPEPGKPYCTYHCCIAYSPARPRKEGPSLYRFGGRAA